MSEDVDLSELVVQGVEYASLRAELQQRKERYYVAAKQEVASSLLDADFLPYTPGGGSTLDHPLLPNGCRGTTDGTSCSDVDVCLTGRDADLLPFIAPGARRYSVMTTSERAWRVVHTVPFQALLLLLLLCDAAVILVLLVYSLHHQDRNDEPGHVIWFRRWALFNAVIFLLEIALRAVGTGCWEFFFLHGPSRTWVNWFESIVLLSNLVLEAVDISGQIPSSSGGIVAMCTIRVLRVVVVVKARGMAAAKIGEIKVSAARRRYRTGRVDLDLTYITSQIIAMSWPSCSVESLYRNHIDNVARFLDTHHPGSYKVYNLCSERSYNTEPFHGRVEHIPVDDHQPCDLRLVKEFCESCDAWLRADSQNVVAVHCKGGKGRTGMMISAYLLWCGMDTSAREATKRFGALRTEVGAVKVQTVESPSQNRYLSYFERTLAAPRCVVVPDGSTLTLSSITIGPLPSHAPLPHEHWLLVVKGSSRDIVWKSDPSRDGERGPDGRRPSTFQRLRGTGRPQRVQDGYSVRVRSGTLDMEYTADQYRSLTEGSGKTKTYGDVYMTYNLTDVPPLRGDVRLHFLYGRDFSPDTWNHDSLWWVWFHTHFIDPAAGLHLTRADIDGAHKEQHIKKYHPDFRMDINFGPPVHALT